MAFLRKNFWRIIIVVVLAAIAWMLYLRIFEGRGWADWTGFVKYETTITSKTGSTVTVTTQQHPGKTLLNWLELLTVPAMLGVGAWYLTRQERRNELEIAYERNQDTFLQSYLDKMSDLLLEKNLKEEKANEYSPVRDVAQVRTVTALRKLDRYRRNIIIRFLRDAELLDSLLVSSSLQEADLSGTNLYEANLSGTNINKADLSGVNLWKTNLGGVLLSGANLDDAIVTPEQLSNAKHVPEKYLTEPEKWLRTTEE